MLLFQKAENTQWVTGSCPKEGAPKSELRQEEYEKQ